MYLIDDVLYKKKISEKTINIDQNPYILKTAPQQHFLMNDISKENTNMNPISNDKVLNTNANTQVTSDNRHDKFDCDTKNNPLTEKNKHNISNKPIEMLNKQNNIIPKKVKKINLTIKKNKKIKNIKKSKSIMKKIYNSIDINKKNAGSKMKNANNPMVDGVLGVIYENYF